MCLDQSMEDFYPRPPRGGRHGLCGIFGKVDMISIHALREEGDLIFAVCVHLFFISIHALREEGDLPSLPFVALAVIFLSTPSARRATCPHRRLPGRLPISIHALREEGDLAMIKGFTR